MTAPWTLARFEVRRRWRGAAAVGLVLGIGSATVLAAAAGARRTETAFPRMLAATHSSHLLVSGGGADYDSRRRFYDRLAGIDGVLRVGRLAAIGLMPVDVRQGNGTVIGSCSAVSVDGVFGYGVDRPNVTRGRLPRRDHADEVLVTDGYARTFGVGVGDRLDLALAPEGAPIVGQPLPAGTHVIRSTIVGIGTLATQIVPISDLDAAPTILAPPALGRRHAPDAATWCYDGATVTLAAGTDMDRVVAAIDRLVEPGGDVLVQDRGTNYADVRRALRPQVTALWLFAVAAALATSMIVAQSLVRQVRQSTSADRPVWRALGLTRPEARILAAAPCVVTALVGGAVALAGAVAVSGRFPIGPARLAETHRGMAVHASIHLGGAAAVVATALFLAMVAGVAAVHGRTRPARAGRLTLLGHGSSKPSVLLGIHLATSSRRGDSAVPVRSAAAGAALAIAAVVATVTFAGGLGDLVSQPSRYGRDWDVMVDGIFAPAPVRVVLDRLGRDPAVAAIGGGRYGDATIDGRKVPTVGMTDLVGTTFPAVIDGRRPRHDDEIVVGRRTLRALGRSVGDTVDLDTGTGPRKVTIVGTVAFPRLNHGSFATLGLGIGAMAPAGVFPPLDPDLSEIPPGTEPDDYVGPGGAMYEFATVRLRPDATADQRRDVVAAARRIADASQEVLRTEQRPIAIDNYAAVRAAPRALALLLASMAAATLAHLVVSVVRRRRRDLAVCVAMGMSRAQVLRAVVLHAVLVATVALCLGLPVGLAAGRAAWTAFASDLGVDTALRLPIGALALVAPLVALVTVAVALAPAIPASRARPALALRTE